MEVGAKWSLPVANFLWHIGMRINVVIIQKKLGYTRIQGAASNVGQHAKMVHRS